MTKQCSFRLTPRDIEILETLTNRVRTLSISQIAKSFWSGQKNSERNAAKRLEQLKGANLLEIRSVLGRQEIPLLQPVVSWSPGETAPDLGRASWTLRKRWKQAQVVPTEIVIATKEAQREFAGSIGGYFPRNSEVTHDIHLGSVFLNHYRNRAEQWISEAQLREEGNRGDTIPDAIIRREYGASPTLIVEFGGSYRKEKLVSMIESYNETPYVIW